VLNGTIKKTIKNDKAVMANNNKEIKSVSIGVDFIIF
jgi:hypothetical protein